MNSNNKKNEKKTRKTSLVRLIAILLIAASIIYSIAYFIMAVFMPSTKMEPFYRDITEWDITKTNILIEDSPVPSTYGVYYENDIIYLSYDFIKDYIDEFIYFDSEEEILTITEADKVMRIKKGDSEYLFNNISQKMPIPMLVKETAYLPDEFLQNIYNISIEYAKDTNLCLITKNDVSHETAGVLDKKAVIRFEPDIKSSIAQKLITGDNVRIYNKNTETGWARVRGKNGAVGYIETKFLDKSVMSEAIPNPLPKQYPIYQAASGKINVVWDQILNQNQNLSEWRYIKPAGLDVLSPTWFSITSPEGDIKSLADSNYVSFAHQNGIEVWALVDNDFDTELTHLFLKSTSTRQKIIDTLVSYAKQYDLDGINIDFENVGSQDGVNFVQFMREASVFFKEEGLVFTCDVYVPAAWTAHYNRNVLSQICDYIMIMAYDEHWSTSEKSGSVASINWVIQGIENTLAEVDANKIILGLPYYTRIWFEETINGNVSVSSKAYGMQEAYDICIGNGINFVWDEYSGQYYGEYTKDDGVLRKIWLEDERSIAEKVKLVDKYNLAGVAGWKRGLEKDEVWTVLNDALKK